MNTASLERTHEFEMVLMSSSNGSFHKNSDIPVTFNQHIWVYCNFKRNCQCYDYKSFLLWFMTNTFMAIHIFAQYNATFLWKPC